MTFDVSLMSLFALKFNIFIGERFKYRFKKSVMSSISAHKIPTITDLGVIPEFLFSSILGSLEFVLINFVAIT